MLQVIRNLDYDILLCQDLARMRSFYHNPGAAADGGCDVGFP
jgi:hypothetical protein